MPRTKKVVSLPKNGESGETKCTCNDTPQPKQEEIKPVEVLTTTTTTEPPKKRGRKPKVVVKKERVASSYATFVKNHYDSVRSLATKDRFKALSELWKKEKDKTKVVK